MKKFNYILFFILVITLSLSLVIGVPGGATVTSISNSTANADPAGQHAAIAGNVSEITLFGYSTTQSWQGYFGNVSGAIRLADSSSNVLYNWSLASPEGEVYSSNASSITWSSINCFNLSNATTFEGMFGIAQNDADGINETFLLGNHAGFFTGSIQHTTGECNNTKVYGPGGSLTYDEVLLTDGTNVVFASLLQENTVGFDNRPHDFEMIVLENGHLGNTATTTYYFWVELE